MPDMTSTSLVADVAPCMGKNGLSVFEREFATKWYTTRCV